MKVEMNEQEIPENKNIQIDRSKVKPVLTGLVAGAILGAAFAWVISEGIEELEEDGIRLSSLKPADYFQLGISVLNLARQFSGMFRG